MNEKSKIIQSSSKDDFDLAEKSCYPNSARYNEQSAFLRQSATISSAKPKVSVNERPYGIQKQNSSNSQK